MYFCRFFPLNFRLQDAGKVNRSIKDIPETRLLECADPPAKPKSPIYPSFNLSTDELPITVKLKDFAWLLARSLTHAPTSNGDDTNGEDPLSSSPVPVWSGYNSLVHETVPVARIGSPPLRSRMEYNANHFHAGATNYCPCCGSRQEDRHFSGYGIIPAR